MSLRARELTCEADRRYRDGLLDIRKLEAQPITVKRTTGKGKDRKTKTLHLDAVEVTDAEFIEWFVGEMDGIKADNRLRFRIVLLSMLKSLKLERRGMKIGGAG